MVGDGLRYHGDDGRSVECPLPRVGATYDDRIEGYTLLRTDAQELVLSRGVEQRETYQRHGEQFRLVRIEQRGGAGLLLRYEYRVDDREMLSDLYTYQGDSNQPHIHLCTQVDEVGHLTGVWLMRVTQAQRRLCEYHYDAAGDLTLARDEDAAEWTYQYQHHLLTRYTDRTGRGMNLQWQGEGPDARAIREWADDGSFDTRLEWDENIRLTYVTDAHGNETWHYCDILGYTYRIIHPDKRSEYYQYDARGNLMQRWKDGKESRYTWDLFNRLTHYDDDQLQVDYVYDALGRRLFKHSQAHYQERREAGSHWNHMARVRRNRELGCGFTLYGWDGDTLAWESTIADADGLGASTTHYVYEPGSFLPVAQTVREEAIALLDQPTIWRLLPA